MLPTEKRQLAQLADKLIAAAPALSPLFARTIYKAMTAQSGWDTLYPIEAALAVLPGHPSQLKQEANGGR